MTTEIDPSKSENTNGSIAPHLKVARAENYNPSPLERGEKVDIPTGASDKVFTPGASTGPRPFDPRVAGAPRLLCSQQDIGSPLTP